jgi:imidazole glycerol-phosphate synthase subunit HisH
MIVILDYRMGNAVSVRNMCSRLGIPAVISRDPDVVTSASHLILPGVGHFSRCIEAIDALNLRALLDHAVLTLGKPILGVCMGMQVMTLGSEEGTGAGLGWLEAHTKRLNVRPAPGGRQAKVPHMGWGYVEPMKPHPVLGDLPADSRFYFVHSYAVECARAGDVLLRSHFAGHDFTSAFASRNIVGVQFHVEKSHLFGMRLLERFAAWDGRA